jgi:hypothetical protein
VKALNSPEGQVVRHRVGQAARHVGRHRGLYAAGTAAAAGGAAYAKSKQASAFETLAEQRANEILEASGIEEVETTKYDVLADAVEQRAAEILAENGYEMAEETDQE